MPVSRRVQPLVDKFSSLCRLEGDRGHGRSGSVKWLWNWKPYLFYRNFVEVKGRKVVNKRISLLFPPVSLSRANKSVNREHRTQPLNISMFAGDPQKSRSSSSRPSRQFLGGGANSATDEERAEGSSRHHVISNLVRSRIP